jgi:hypothetical protein
MQDEEWAEIRALKKQKLQLQILQLRADIEYRSLKTTELKARLGAEIEQETDFVDQTIY